MWRRGPRLNKYPEPESGAAMQRCEVLRPGGQNAARGKIKPLLWVAHSDPRPRRLNQKLPAYAEHHNLSGGAAGGSVGGHGRARASRLRDRAILGAGRFETSRGSCSFTHRILAEESFGAAVR